MELKFLHGVLVGVTGSAIVYAGVIVAFIGLFLIIKPTRRSGLRTRRRGAIVAVFGLLITATGFLLPAGESRVARSTSRLDEFTPAWQFNELHTIRIAAPPERVYAAVKSVRADEIALFNILTWIRRGGRPLRESILNAGATKPLLDVATQSGFIWLADESPRELVIGTIIAAPRGAATQLTPATFRKNLPPGNVLATMNFTVRPDGAGGSLVSTETRVHANDASSRRRFAVYWRVIYPGSAIIRRMWLRAIEGGPRINVTTGASTPCCLARGSMRGRGIQDGRPARPVRGLIYSTGGCRIRGGRR